MKFKLWLWASLILLATLAATLALFSYWDRLRNESIQTLQTRLNSIELSHFEDEKSNQIIASAQEEANRFSQIIGQAKAQAEAIADAPALQQPAQRPSELTKKRSTFSSLATSTHWSGAVLTNESGVIVAAVGRRTLAGSLAANPAFAEAARAHHTVVRLDAVANGQVQAQFTVPCLHANGTFLGVLQAESILSANQLAGTNPNNVVTILGTAQGLRLHGGPDNFPQYLGALIQKTPQETETLIRQNARRYSRATWEKITYLMVSTPTAIPDIYIFTLLEVTGLEKFVNPRTLATSLFGDPVILGGVIVILLAGLGLLHVISGLGLGGLQKIHEQLDHMFEEGGELTTVQLQDTGELGKLADLINLLVARIRQAEKVSATATSSSGGAAGDQAWLRAEANLADLQASYDRLRGLKEESDQRVEELLRTNQALLQAPPVADTPSAPPEDYAHLEALVRDFKQSGSLRIEAIQNMSEDLKATLTVIKNYISSILSSEEGKITDSQQEFLGVVINRSARLERQINDLLDISHMESEEDQGAFIQTDLVAMLEDVILNIQSQADSKQIRLITEIQPSLPEVMINSDRMGQVLINLVQHALKITPVGGEVQITAAEIFSGLVVKIKDGGTALTNEQAAQVFTAFNGPETPAGPDLAGTGLRFPIIKRILDFNHGTIMLRGIPDQGNEIVITFPRDSNQATPPTAGLESFADSQPMSKSESETFFDLSAFMGQGNDLSSPAPVKVAGGEDNLAALIKDIDNPQ